jgi:aarF domain-containing kinase
MSGTQVIRKALRVGMGASGVGIVGAGSYAFYLYEKDPGTRRMVKAYSTFLPIVLHYRWAEWRHKSSQLSDSEWEAMDELYAQPTVATLGELQGMYTKYGQTCAGFTNTFGDAWIRELRKLEDKVPPRPAETVYKTIEQETGKPVSETFMEFDPTPLGSASIGQVHKARLKDGRQVAVKVQYHEAKELFHEDMQTSGAFCKVFAPEQVIVMDALEKQNRVELDYLTEAKNLIEVAENMKKHGFMPREVLVPKPLPEYSTKRMLVMELFPGPKLIDGVNAYFDKWAREHGTTLHELEKQARQKMEEEGIPAVYDGPSAFKIGIYRKCLQLQDALCNVAIGTYNTTAGLVGSSKMEYRKSVLPPNTPRIIDTLMRVHGYQLMVDGFFNADPHGKNNSSVGQCCSEA